MTRTASTLAGDADPLLSRRVTVVGAGLAGTLISILLDRAGCHVTLVDSLKSYPNEFRAEQVVSESELRRLGLFEAVVGDARVVHQAKTFRLFWRWGWLARSATAPHYGIRYDTMVNGARRHLPASIEFVNARVEDIDVSDSWQRVKLRDGRVFESRLVILATGLHSQLLGKLGISRKMLSKDHSVAIGFDVEVDCHEAFRSRVLTIHGNNWLGGEKNGAINYATFFLIGNSLRGNIFTNGKCNSDWTREFKLDPIATLLRAIPWLQDETGKILQISNLKVRPSDIMILENHSKPGVVCVGDTFLTPCPATGTGISRMLNEIDLLGTRYVPQWLESPGMSAEKISAFYADPGKLECDASALSDAMYHRGITTKRGFKWIVRRAKAATCEQWQRGAKWARTRGLPQV